MKSRALKLVAVLPTYNEGENIRALVEALFALNIDGMRILIVDDNSPDGTGDIADSLAEAYPDRVIVLHRPQKQGLGPAYIDGFKGALSLGAELILQMDADFSHQPKYIPKLLENAGDYDIVIGSRYVPGGSVDEAWGPLRKLLSWWANTVYTPSILRFPVRDATGGFKLFRRECLLGLGLNRIKANGYVFQIEVNYVAYKLGYAIKELPIHFPERERGHSKMSAAIAWEAALRVLEIMMRHRSLSPEERHSESFD